MTEENRETKEVGLFELLRELANRIKSEIFLLAFVFALIIAFVGITTQFSSVIGATFIGIYSIAVISYMIIKARETSRQVKEESREYIKWTITSPKAFQNPFEVLKETPNLRIVHFNIDLKLKNMSKKPLSSRFYIRSPSQAVVFIWDEPIEKWGRKFVFIPYKEKYESSLDIFETQKIDPNQTAKYRFHAWYRPHRAFKDFRSRYSIVLTYQIYAESEDSIFNRTYFNTETRKIEIPFKDKVQYASEKDHVSNS